MPTIYCVGRNYAAHAREMGADARPAAEPVVFLKPWGAILAPPGPISLPRGSTEVHHEAELVVRVGPGTVAEAVALGLDLTDRPRQAAAKKEGLPWARAKGFRGSAPLGPFVPVSALPPIETLKFTLRIGGAVRQRGDASLMLTSVPAVLADLDRWFGLVPGDLVFTGTPEGVGPLASGDRVELTMDGSDAATARFVVV